jgi:hypothetical protein
MAYIECRKHGGIVCTFGTISIANAIENRKKKLHRNDVKRIEFRIDENIPEFGLWVEIAEMNDIGSIADGLHDGSDLSENDGLLELMRPICPLCLAEKLDDGNG